jgi:hypothetical protein
MPAQVELEREPVFDGGQAFLVQAARRGLDELAVDAVERGTPPQPERVAVGGDGLVEVAGVASCGYQFPEPLRVQLPGASARYPTWAVRPAQ